MAAFAITFTSPARAGLPMDASIKKPPNHGSHYGHPSIHICISLRNGILFSPPSALVSGWNPLGFCWV